MKELAEFNSAEYERLAADGTLDTFIAKHQDATAEELESFPVKEIALSLFHFDRTVTKADIASGPFSRVRAFERAKTTTNMGLMLFIEQPPESE